MASRLGTTLLATAMAGAAVPALGSTVTSENAYLEMGFEELLDVEVTSGARRAQSVEQSAASVFVISQDDIRRSPARNVPELLAMAPGVQVQRLDYNSYRVSIRGGAQLYANKLLVMIDGRSVYTPTFGGVYWDQHDVLLEDIDRIEVVRGPGGTVWGANAVNGVINVITKSAVDTDGLYVNAEYGDEDEPTVGVRLGGGLRGGGAARLGLLYSAKPSISPNEATFFTGTDGETFQVTGDNAFETGKIDFRLDQPIGERTVFTLTSALQKGEFGDAFGRGAGFVQAHVLARVERETARGGITVQAFADHSDREGYGIGVTTNVFDIDLSHHFTAGSRHHVVWGAGFRFMDDEFTKVSFDPEQTDWRASFFAQDEIAFADDALKVTLGTKLEYNSITGFEYQPSVRALWRFTERSTVWGALSRNVRTPSRADRTAQFDIEIDQDVLLPVGLVGNQDVDTETSYTAELGLRSRVTDRLSFEGSVFATYYDDLIKETANPATAPPVFPVFLNRFENSGEARSLGVEIAANAHPIDPLTLQLAYAYIDLDVDQDGGAPTPNLVSDQDVVFGENGTSQHTVSLRGTYDVTDALFASAWLRYASEPLATDLGDGVDLDLRLTWAPGPVRASIIGENLLSDEDDFEGEEYLETLTELSPTARRLTAKLELDL